LQRTPSQAILCVDDEPIILMSLKTKIRYRYKNRMTVETALSAEEALLAITEMKEEGLDVIVVISDWQMPGMKGDTFLKLLDKEHPNIHLIMITGQADPETLKNLQDTLPRLAILSKPWDSSLLASHIDLVTDLNP
jgi:CheY-like chemotaxis protein